MTRQESINAIEERAIAARKTMTEVCRLAGVDYATWYRATRNPAGVSLGSLDKIETALTAIEKERAAASA